MIWLLSHLPSPVELDKLCNRTEEVLDRWGWGKGLPHCLSVPSQKMAHACAQYIEASGTGEWIRIPIPPPDSSINAPLQTASSELELPQISEWAGTQHGVGSAA